MQTHKQDDYITGPHNYWIHFVAGQEPVEVSDRLAKVVALAVQHDAAVLHLLGALAILTFGTLPSSLSKVGSRGSLVAALRQQLGGHIKILHGAAEGSYGLFGAKSQLAYTFLVPHFDQVLANLGSLPFGAVQEVTP